MGFGLSGAEMALLGDQGECLGPRGPLWAIKVSAWGREGLVGRSRFVVGAEKALLGDQGEHFGPRGPCRAIKVSAWGTEKALGDQREGICGTFDRRHSFFICAMWSMGTNRYSGANC